MNALTRNTSISVGERFKLYKSYEDALKHDRDELIRQQEKICSKLSIVAKPPKHPSGGNLNRHLLVVNKPFERKSAFIENLSPNKDSFDTPQKSSLAKSYNDFTTLKTMISKEDPKRSNARNGKPCLQISKSFVQ